MLRNKGQVIYDRTIKSISRSTTKKQWREIRIWLKVNREYLIEKVNVCSTLTAH